MTHTSMLSKSLLISLALLAPLASAQNLYVNDLSLKSNLDWLDTQGVIQINTSMWPLTDSEIRQALNNAKATTPAQLVILSSVEASLTSAVANTEQDTFRQQMQLYAQTDREMLPQSFADDHTATAKASYQVGYGSDNWEAKLQANLKHDDIINDQEVSFEGSYVAGKLANQWLIAGQIPTWWGPGHDGSLIRGDASIPVAGVTLQRDRQSVSPYKTLSWIGPWQYQVFAGQLDGYDAVPHAKLLGLRLTANPWSWLEIGASRSIMWGGEGRPESVSSLIDAIAGTRDNGGTGNPDPANQLAGFDARVNFSEFTAMPLSAYAQYVGEDEAGAMPAKNMYLAGVDYASSFDRKDGHVLPYQLYAEYTDTRTSGEVRGISYDHSNYNDGYYQHGYPLGYALGGDSESITVGGKLWVDSQNFINGKLQYAKVNQSGEIDRRSGQSDNQAFPESDTISVADVSWEHQYNPYTAISSRVWAVDSDLEDTEVGAGIGVTFENF